MIIRTLLILTLSSLLGYPQSPVADGDPFQKVLEAVDDKALARSFFNLVDFTQPLVADLKPLVEGGREVEALWIWRDRMVARLRAVDYGKFNWHGSHVATAGLAAADLWVGRTPPAGVKVFNIHETHLDGLCGDPDKPAAIQWITDTSAKATGQEMPYFEANFRFFTLLIGAYYKSGDPIYLKKWYQVLDDFLRNERPMASVLDKNDCRNWSAGGNASALRTASRMIWVTRSFAAVAKMIPDGGKTGKPDQVIPDWEQVNLPRTAPAARPDTLPAGLLARWAVSLVKDHADYMIQLYVTNANRVPNQRFEGIVGCTVALSLFRELKRAETHVFSPVNAGLTEYLENSLNRDGTVLEQAFNYNPGTLEGLAQIRTMVSDLPPGMKEKFPAAKGIEESLDLAERVFSMALLRPVRGPQFKDNVATVGGGGLDESRTPWLDPTNPAYRQVLPEAPAFTSVALPFGGYYALRGGWEPTNLFLFMQNSRRARGHLYPNNLGVELSCFGRHLLAPGPFPWYTASMAPAHQQGEFKAFYDYFGENRPLNRNVVLVNGLTQHKRNRDNTILTAGARTPVPGRWHTSDAFDVVDGTWDGGWYDPALGSSAEKEGTKVLPDAVHGRRVVHLRGLDLVVVADAVSPGEDGPQTMTQVWNFPPKVTGPKPMNGFEDEQVVLRTAEREIATRDPSGPNLTLAHFTPAEISYERFHGSTEGGRYRGWYLLGAAVPKTDIHVHWQERGETQPLLTLLAPSPGLAPTVKTKRDQSTPGVAAFSALHASGRTVFAACAPGVKSLAAGPFTAKAEMLLFVGSTDGQNGKGVALGCRSLTLSASLPIPGPDFEFEIRGGKWVDAKPIRSPETFRWVHKGGALAPEYR